MYELTYPAPGDPHLAEQAASLLTQAGVETLVDSNIGWDHGVFIPLMAMYPDADIPVVAMSLTTGRVDDGAQPAHDNQRRAINVKATRGVPGLASRR